MKYSEVILNLSNSILDNFDEVYHDAEIITNDSGLKLPAVSKLDEWVDLSPSDQKEIIYIRRNGDDYVYEDLKLGGCIKAYKMTTSLRVVYFKDYCKNQNEVFSKLLQSVLIGGIKLKSIIRDKFRLQKDESSGDYKLGAITAYFGINVDIFWELTPSTCDEDFCTEIENPLCRVVV